jgi:hypothetical protein
MAAQSSVDVRTQINTKINNRSSMETLDIIVTGTRNTVSAREARSILMEYVKRQDRLDVNVLYYAISDEDESRSNISEHDWLLYNAARASFICHVRYADVSQIRTATLTAVAAVIDNFRKTQDMTIFENPLHDGRVSIYDGSSQQQILGVDTIYYNVHNKTRLLREMSDTFRGRLPRIALLVPMSLRGLKDRNNIPLLSTLFPSLQRTSNHCYMTRGLYLGVDEDEVLTTNLLDIIRDRAQKTLKIIHESTLRFPREWRVNEVNSSRMYNALYREAMMDGYDFAVQMQDDARIETPMWDRLMGSALCLQPLVMGAYSFQDRINSKRLTNVMVSRTHFDVFGFLFNELAPDASRWCMAVLGCQYARVIERVKVTNTITTSRRQVNGTGHVYQSIGQDAEEEVYALDRERFAINYLTPLGLKPCT